MVYRVNIVLTDKKSLPSSACFWQIYPQYTLPKKRSSNFCNDILFFTSLSAFDITHSKSTLTPLCSDTTEYEELQVKVFVMTGVGYNR